MSETGKRLPTILYPEFFTPTQWREAAKNDAKENLLDSPPVVKLFTPDGAATWLISSISRANPNLAFGLCDLGLGFPELGYVNLEELAGLRGRLGLPVERDHHCVLNQSLRHYADKADMMRSIQV